MLFKDGCTYLIHLNMIKFVTLALIHGGTVSFCSMVAIFIGEAAMCIINIIVYY